MSLVTESPLTHARPAVQGESNGEYSSVPENSLITGSADPRSDWLEPKWLRMIDQKHTRPNPTVIAGTNRPEPNSLNPGQTILAPSAPEAPSD